MDVELSIFYARLLGIYLLIMAIVMLFRRKQIEGVAGELFASRGLLYLAGALNLLIGLIIAITHPIWEINWRGLITLLGYIAILKGFMRVGFYEQSRVFESKMLRAYWVIFVIVVILGVYLTYSGFSH